METDDLVDALAPVLAAFNDLKIPHYVTCKVTFGQESLCVRWSRWRSRQSKVQALSKRGLAWGVKNSGLTYGFEKTFLFRRIGLNMATR